MAVSSTLEPDFRHKMLDMTTKSDVCASAAYDLMDPRQVDPVTGVGICPARNCTTHFIEQPAGCVDRVVRNPLYGIELRDFFDACLVPYNFTCVVRADCIEDRALYLFCRASAERLNSCLTVLFGSVALPSSAVYGLRDFCSNSVSTSQLSQIVHFCKTSRAACISHVSFVSAQGQ